VIGGAAEEIGTVTLKYLSSHHAPEITPVAGVPSLEGPETIPLSELSSDYNLILKVATLSSPDSILRSIDQVTLLGLTLSPPPHPFRLLEHQDSFVDPSSLRRRHRSHRCCDQDLPPVTSREASPPPLKDLLLSCPCLCFCSSQHRDPSPLPAGPVPTTGDSFPRAL
jgi:hypothetical protein